VFESRHLATKTVLDYHRLQAENEGAASCALLTEEAQAARVTADQRIAATLGEAPPESCEQAVEQYLVSPAYREAMYNTTVDSIQIDGTRATAQVHTVVPTTTGVSYQLQPVELQLRWVDGRWLLD
jgi:hypothetical protein